MHILRSQESESLSSPTFSQLCAPSSAFEAGFGASKALSTSFLSSLSLSEVDGLRISVSGSRSFGSAPDGGVTADTGTISIGVNGLCAVVEAAVLGVKSDPPVVAAGGGGYIFIPPTPVSTDIRRGNTGRGCAIAAADSTITGSIGMPGLDTSSALAGPMDAAPAVVGLVPAYVSPTLSLQSSIELNARPRSLEFPASMNVPLVP